jgi:hypothetical protein
MSNMYALTLHPLTCSCANGALNVCIRHFLMLPPSSHSLRQRRKAPQKVTRALIPTRIPIQILLMVSLGIPPLSRRQDLRGNSPLPPLLIHLLGDLLRNLLLLGVVVENSTAVLRAHVGALAVRGGGVVHLVEEFEERAVLDLGGVIDYLKRFGVCGEG